MLRTSINMRHAIFVKIGFAAARLGLTRRDVVLMLLSRIMRDIDQFQGGLSLVKYQPRDPRKLWHCFPIRLKKNENEFATDFRKLGRYSVSYLVAIATERYLDEMLQNPESRHNYTEFSHYTIGRRTEGDIICWEFYWGDPTDTLTRSSPIQIIRSTASPWTTRIRTHD